VKYKLKNGMIVEKISDLPKNNLILCEVIKPSADGLLWSAGEQFALVVEKPGDWPKGGLLGDKFDVIERV
jgi:hypothetical protein